MNTLLSLPTLLTLLSPHASFALADIAGFFTNLRNEIVGFALAASACFFAWAAILYMVSGHNDRRIEQARMSLYSALGGLALALLAVTIATLVSNAAAGQ